VTAIELTAARRVSGDRLAGTVILTAGRLANSQAALATLLGELPVAAAQLAAGGRSSRADRTSDGWTAGELPVCHWQSAAAN
jgi:hypothetical protein